MTSNPSLDGLSDQALLGQFGDLVQQDQRRTASLLRHIDAIDRRKLWARQGHPSMFDFCVSRYHMSESTAGKRIGAARTARRFPILFAMVARGEIHLSGIHTLKTHLTAENHEQVLAEAKHKTIRQIEQLVARLAPQADVPSTLRALPRRRATVPPTVPPTSALAPIVPAAPVATEPVATAPVPRTPPSPRRSPDPAPPAPGRYKLQVTLDENTRDKLKQLQDLLAHQIPSGDPAAIIARALDALLTQVHKRKTGITEKPRAASGRLPSEAAPSQLRCVATCGCGTKDAARSSARTATAATRRGVSNSRTCIRGGRMARTVRLIWLCAAKRTTSSKPSATLALASWPVR